MRRANERGAVVDLESGFFPIVSNQVFSFNPPLHPEARRILTQQMMPRNVGRFLPLALYADAIDDASFRPRTRPISLSWTARGGSPYPGWGLGTTDAGLRSKCGAVHDLRAGSEVVDDDG